MKLLQALLLLAAAAAAQTTTTVVATIVDAMGGHPSGTCTFQTEVQFTSGGGWSVVGVPRVVAFSSGALSVALVPTDSATVGGMRYRKACRLPLQTSGGTNCEGNPTLLAGGGCVVGPASLPITYLQVPTSSDPIELSTIEFGINPDPILQHWKGNYSPGSTYKVGDGVLCQAGGSCSSTYNGIAFISIQGGGSGHTPGSSPSWWVPLHTRQATDYAGIYATQSALDALASGTHTLLSGTGFPSGGSDGDLYLRTSTTCLYGPKASGSWPGGCTSLIGAAGSGFLGAGSYATMNAASPSNNSVWIRDDAAAPGRCDSALGSSAATCIYSAFFGWLPAGGINTAGKADGTYCVAVASGVPTLTTCPTGGGGGGGSGTAMTWAGVSMTWNGGGMTWN